MAASEAAKAAHRRASKSSGKLHTGTRPKYRQSLPRVNRNSAGWQLLPPHHLSVFFFSHKIALDFLEEISSAMIFDGKIDLEVPQSKAWDFLTDINKFSGCLPGIEEVRQIDDRSFEGVLAATVGPISGKFSFRSSIVESRPPQQMVVRTEGTDSVTKSTVHVDMTVNLHKLSDQKSEMDYRADVNIQGRLAILGDMVLRATATLILQEFARRLHKGLAKQA
jgi:carbon monoxide dehydrogenase subunit G